MSVQPAPRGRILVVEDDATVSEILARYLAREGYDVESVGDGRDALERTRSQPPDLILLDLMLPGMSGLEVCRRVRGFAAVPIIMLTARGEEHERVFGLKLGADDYVVKPFSPREVTARVDSVLRRAHHAGRGDERAGAVLEAGPIRVDLAARTVAVDGRRVELTAREFELLAFLMRQPDEAFSREELLERVWGYRFGDTATVTVHVRRLRAKVEADPSQPEHLQTVWGVGYRFAS
jgi:two-component system response regulator ResD